MKQTASGWVILTRNLVGGFHPQNDSRIEPRNTKLHETKALLKPRPLPNLHSPSGAASLLNHFLFRVFGEGFVVSTAEFRINDLMAICYALSLR